uniref:Disease resistance R13L4/SHOC-2-like LRR domain-containing protein n=1 Tax=Salix viminalis TaxID=40686 RepID=A0A6N2MLD0_SALVM
MKQLTYIRSLNVSRSSIKEIPKEVGKLIHLRHLNLKGCKKLVSLPETMCDLCNLQSLDCSCCMSLKELPRATVKLVNLRHLCIDGSGVAFMPKGIERLTCLRTLDCFIVCGGGENESKAANLRELKSLNHIRGSLVIWNLQGGGIEDTAEALLKNKNRLLCLKLNFGLYREDGILIEFLQPPLDLERLSINFYKGIVLPNWMMELTRLQELELHECGNLEVLPPLGRLPALESLQLNRVGVRRLDAGFLGIEEVENANINEGEIAKVTAFPKLKTLHLLFLTKLEEWDGNERRVGEEDATTTSTFIMPQLQHLQIHNCPLLRALPDYVLAASLQHLKLIECGKLEVLSPLGRLPNLESLELINVGLKRLDAGFLGIKEVENANINEGEIAKVTAFLKLKSLGIANLQEVEEWDGIERRVGEEDATATSIVIMPQLQPRIVPHATLPPASPADASPPITNPPVVFFTRFGVLSGSAGLHSCIPLSKKTLFAYLLACWMFTDTQLETPLLCFHVFWFALQLSAVVLKNSFSDSLGLDSNLPQSQYKESKNGV